MFRVTFLLQIFSKLGFHLKSLSKIVRLLLAALSVNGLRVPIEIVLRIIDTFNANFGIRNDFTKLLKERCWLCSE